MNFLLIYQRIVTDSSQEKKHPHRSPAVPGVVDAVSGSLRTVCAEMDKDVEMPIFFQEEECSPCSPGSCNVLLMQ